MPTRNGRNGMIFTTEGIINIRNEKWKEDFSPLDPTGVSFVATTYTKAYLRHLTISGEMLAAQIASLHNIAFYLWLVREARAHILDDTYAEWKPWIIEKISRRL
jgi:queuine tRNA-ribosyltransferase